MAERRQKCNTIHTEFPHLLHIQVLDDISRDGKVRRIKELEVWSVLHTQIAMLDQPGVGSNAATGTLAENMVQSDDRYGTTVDDLLEHSSRTYRRQLIRITNQNQSGIRWYCSKQPVCQEGVHHGDFVNQDQIRVEHSAFRQRSIFSRLNTQSFMDRGSRKSGGLLHPLSRLSCRRTAYYRRIRIFVTVTIDNCVFKFGPHFLSVNCRKSRNSLFSISNLAISFSYSSVVVRGLTRGRPLRLDGSLICYPHKRQ